MAELLRACGEVKSNTSAQFTFLIISLRVYMAIHKNIDELRKKNADNIRRVAYDLKESLIDKTVGSAVRGLDEEYRKLMKVADLVERQPEIF